MLTLQLQDAKNHLPTDAVCVLIQSVASRWNENGQVLVWNLFSRSHLRGTGIWPMFWQVPVRHTVACWSFFLHRHMWSLVKHCEISFGVLEAPCRTCQVVFSVFRILKVFAVPLCILERKIISGKIIWRKIFADETVAAYHSISPQVFPEQK